MMRRDILPELLAKLKADYGFKPAGEYLRKGRCPGCGKTELFTSAKEPWVLRCGRENNCGWTGKTRELYPDLFGKMNERFPATTADPNATADAYMSFVRHIQGAGLTGWWRQGRFSHPKGSRTTATVVFDILAPGETETSNRWMERLIEPVDVREEGGEIKTRKANFVGLHKGLWWQPPGMVIDPKDEVWIVEGCIDAVSLHKVGIKAVAALSSGNYPERMLADLQSRGLRPALVWALDGDKAGKVAICKHVEAARKAGWDCRAAIIPQEGRKKTDWNDALGQGRLTDADLKRYRFHGALLLAETPLEKALLIWERKRSSFFSLEFKNRTYWFEIPAETYAITHKLVMEEGELTEEADIRMEAARRSAALSEVANCAFQFLYFQQSEMTDESWYYTRVQFPHGRFVIKNTFTGAQIATGSEFKKRLLSIAPGALFAGGTNQLNWIVKHNLDDIKIVKTVDFIGYSKEHKTYVFNDKAVSAGKIYDINDEDFFVVGSLSVKSLNASLHLHIGTHKQYQPEWLPLVYNSFGAKGLVGVVFFFGSLFAEQIRDLHKSYPFLEIVGEAGAGKSTLIEFLWKLVGRVEYEGFDPSKSTPAARARIMSQAANLPVSFIESDREDTAKRGQFDWDELKTAYNGRASRARGVKNGGNETIEPLFRGSILISQNAAVNASEAIMQRLIHLRFDTRGHTAGSKAAADDLASIPVEAVSHFLLLATMREAQVMKTVGERTPFWEKELICRPTIRSVRIAKNHAQLMSLAEALAELTQMPLAWLSETQAILTDAADQRQQAIAGDHQFVEEFWDLVDYIGLARLNHAHQDDDIIALNLAHVADLASKHGQPMAAMLDLKRHLKSSRSRAFVDNCTIRSKHNDYQGQVLRCWTFKKYGGM